MNRGGQVIDGTIKIDDAIKDVRARFPFPEIYEHTEDTVRVLAGLLRELAPSGGRLLDIGCGAMDKTAVYQKIGFDCFASDDFLDYWHSREENQGPLLEFAHGVGIQVNIQAETLSIPWELGSFDIVTIVNVIEHLHESPRELLNFAGSCLKTGGLLLVGMPNSVNLRKRLSVLQGKSNYTPAQGFYEFLGPWRGHIREFTLQETCDIVRWTGFEVVYKKTFHGMLRDRLQNPVLRSLFKGISIPFPTLRDSLIAVGRKPADWQPRQPDPDAIRMVDGHEGYSHE